MRTASGHAGFDPAPLLAPLLFCQDRTRGRGRERERERERDWSCPPQVRTASEKSRPAIFFGCPGNSSVAEVVIQDMNLEYGERLCEHNTKHKSTKAPGHAGFDPSQLLAPLLLCRWVRTASASGTLGPRWATLLHVFAWLQVTVDFLPPISTYAVPHSQRSSVPQACGWYG